MADPVNDRYRKAAQVRLSQMMPPGYMPNKPDEYGAGQIMRALGLLPAVPKQSATVRATPPALPPFEQPGAVANKYMPPLAPPTMPPVTVTAQQPQSPLMPPITITNPTPVDMAQMPMGVGGEAMPPNGADPTIPLPQQYSHLNPTPGLEEVFRREYAANPRGFTPGRLFGLLG